MPRNRGITNVAPSNGAPPWTAVEGDTYWHTATKTLYVYNGTAWQAMGAGAGLPPGGTTFQVLAKAGPSDGDVAWRNPEAVLRRITQTAHGLQGGEIVRGATNWGFYKACADTEDNAEVVGAVYQTDGADAFWLISHGRFAPYNRGDLVGGAAQYLSPTVPGMTQAAEPTTPGQISKPIMIAENSAQGWLINMRGLVVPPTTPPWNTAWGKVGFAQRTTNQTGIGATFTQILQCDFTQVAGRMYRVQANFRVIAAGGAARPIARLSTTPNANLLQDWIDNIDAAVQYSVAQPVFVGAMPFASSTGVRVELQQNAGAGTIETQVTANNPAQLWVEDIGPV